MLEIIRNWTVCAIFSFRQGVPLELKKVEKETPVNSSVTWYQINDCSDLPAQKKNKMILTSYVVRKSGGAKKNCLVMSSVPVVRGVTKDDRATKPQIIKLYDYSKGGKDKASLTNLLFLTNI